MITSNSWISLLVSRFTFSPYCLGWCKAVGFQIDPGGEKRNKMQVVGSLNASSVHIAGIEEKQAVALYGGRFSQGLFSLFSYLLCFPFPWSSEFSSLAAVPFYRVLGTQAGRAGIQPQEMCLDAAIKDSFLNPIYISVVLYCLLR